MQTKSNRHYAKIVQKSLRLCDDSTIISGMGSDEETAEASVEKGSRSKEIGAQPVAT
jgi:hypothetical protein